MATDPEEKIRALERELQELREAMQQLSERVGKPVERRGVRTAAAPTEATHVLMSDMRDRMQKVLRGDSEENLESHIGSVWVSRLATLVTMTAVAVGARVTFLADDIMGVAIGAREKALLGYVLSIAFVIYGVFAQWRQRRGRANPYDRVFSEAVLGCGLAGLYFVTYAVFFVDGMRLLPPSIWGLVPTFGGLVLLAIVCHWQRSQTVAGIAFLLAYYTVLVSGVQSPTLESLLYALLTCAGLALATVLFHLAHKWTLLTWAALAASQGAYVWFFVLQDPMKEYTVELHLYGLSEAQSFFWLSNGFLYVCFVAISLACIINAWKTGEFRKQVAPMAGVNSSIFFCLTWFSIRTHYLELEWLFRSGIALTFLVFALLAAMAGPRRNYLFQVFIAKAIIMVTLALQAYLSGEKLLVALALEALGLGFSYQRSGIVIFKVLGLALSGITLVATLGSVRMSGHAEVLGYEVPANWFSAVGVAAVFCVIAWFYEHFGKRTKVEDRKYKAQWLLADSFLDVHPASFGIIHAAGTAILLLTITILDLGEQPQLPYLLMGQGVILAVLGVISRTPQLDVASVLLLVAAHLCFHVFLWMPMAGFEQQPWFTVLTVGLALFTYVGAFAWERYLLRIHKKTAHPLGRRRSDRQAEIEHHLVSSVPYLLATFLLTTLISRVAPPVFVPPAQAGLGALLLFAGYILGLHGVKGSGVLAALIATGTLYMGIQWPNATLHHEPAFVLSFTLYLFALAVAERLFRYLQGRRREEPRLTEILRTGYVALLALMGALCLYKWNETPSLALGLLAMGLGVMVGGVVFRESRYRWAALCIMSLAVMAAFLRLDLSDPVSFLSFAAAASVLLGTSWAYSRGAGIRRSKPAPPAAAAAPPEPAEKVNG